ncbi:MAG: chorismate synthase [Muribaculaceae bacterium]|nr:chorismate synthase [Muribaculaceae bacterium]
MAHKNRIGNLFSFTSFGESHGPAIGGVIDGMPAGVTIDMEQLQHEMARRRPGQGGVTSSRNEPDEVEFLSGVMDGVTLGTPIGFIIRNHDQRSEDYDHLKDVYRPSHADYTCQAKYGIRDHRGGGRASARETAARVVAGALAKQALTQLGVTITASQVSQVSQVSHVSPENSPSKLDGGGGSMTHPSQYHDNTNDTPSQGDTYGGVVACVIKGVPAGIGEPAFGKLSAQLAEAMMSIPAAKGFEIGLGFDFVNHPGSEVLDKWVINDGKISTMTNFSGGIQGGISNGNDITFNVAFKPVATLMQPVEGIDNQGNAVTIEPRGRHDACVVPRAIPVVEAMAAIVILDNMLINRASRL